MLYLCSFDIQQIQGYVFSSNKLKDNLGGSIIVKKALVDYLIEAGREIWGDGWETKAIDDFFDQTECPALRVFCSGGNAMVVVRDPTEAEDFVKKLLSRIMKESPDLAVAANVIEWDTEQNTLGVILNNQHEALFEQKTAMKIRRYAEIPMVCSRCNLTGQPAVAFSREVFEDTGNLVWYSESVFNRRQQVENESDSIESLLSPKSKAVIKQWNLVFSDKLDHMRGRKFEKSYIGVIHIDANGMGTKFKNLIAKAGSPRIDLQKIQTASYHVDGAATSSVISGIEWILDNIKKGPDKDERPHIFGTPLIHDERRIGKYVIPMRKIVSAGDDLTIVSEGSIALDLAAIITRSFTNKLRIDPIFADTGVCAGVALGKAHAPFAQLYKLAEHACSEAKKTARKKGNASFLNYQFYEKPAHNKDSVSCIGCRPFSLEDPDPVLRLSGTPAWWEFRKLILREFQNDEEQRHTQIKNLELDILGGPDKTQNKLAILKSRGIDLTHLFEHTSDLTHFRDMTPYIEAIELMDFVPPPDPNFPTGLYKGDKS